MKILVDSDACPVKEIIVRLAKQRNIPVTMLIDTSHQINDGDTGRNRRERSERFSHSEK